MPSSCGMGKTRSDELGATRRRARLGSSITAPAADVVSMPPMFEALPETIVGLRGAGSARRIGTGCTHQCAQHTRHVTDSNSLDRHDDRQRPDEPGLELFLTDTCEVLPARLTRDYSGAPW